MATEVLNQAMGHDGGMVGKGSPAYLTMDATKALRAADAHGRYADAARRGKLFYAASQAATTWTVALATTYTGLVVYNPPNSGLNLEILQVGFALSAAPAAIAHIGLFGGFLNTGIATHTTPLTPGCTLIGSPAGIGKADAAATLVGTPTWLMPFMGGFTAAALPSTSPAMLDVAGSIIVAPGGYVGIGALTAVVGFGGIVWEEVSL